MTINGAAIKPINNQVPRLAAAAALVTRTRISSTSYDPQYCILSNEVLPVWVILEGIKCAAINQYRGMGW